MSRSDGNDNADWDRTVETAACERWGLEHVAGDVAVPGWYDATTTRMLADASDSRVSAFGSIGAIMGERRFES